MHNHRFVVDKSFDDYSGELQRFILDVAKEYASETSEGLLTELARQEDENSAFNLLKSQGYDIAYDEFMSYYVDVKKIITDNENFLGSMMKEDSATELSEIELENVAGGRSFLNRATMAIIGSAIGGEIIVGSLVAAHVVAPIAGYVTSQALDSPEAGECVSNLLMEGASVLGPEGGKLVEATTGIKGVSKGVESLLKHD